MSRGGGCGNGGGGCRCWLMVFGGWRRGFGCWMLGVGVFSVACLVVFAACCVLCFCLLCVVPRVLRLVCLVLWVVTRGLWRVSCTFCPCSLCLRSVFYLVLVLCLAHVSSLACISWLCVPCVLCFATRVLHRLPCRGLSSSPLAAPSLHKYQGYTCNQR